MCPARFWVYPVCQAQFHLFSDVVISRWSRRSGMPESSKQFYHLSDGNGFTDFGLRNLLPRPSAPGGTATRTAAISPRSAWLAINCFSGARRCPIKSDVLYPGLPLRCRHWSDPCRSGGSLPFLASSGNVLNSVSFYSTFLGVYADDAYFRLEKQRLKPTLFEWTPTANVQHSSSCFESLKVVVAR